MAAWSKEQVAFHDKLLRAVAGKTSWVEIAGTCFEDFSPAPPASEESIAGVERRLGLRLPEQLRLLYRECDGIDAGYRQLVLPIEEMVSRNDDLRNNPNYADLYMPFENLLFFGEEGNGDLFGYAIKKDGTYGRLQAVFEWDHESDSRSWKADSLRGLLMQIATDYCC